MLPLLSMIRPTVAGVWAHKSDWLLLSGFDQPEVVFRQAFYRPVLGVRDGDIENQPDPRQQNDSFMADKSTSAKCA